MERIIERDLRLLCSVKSSEDKMVPVVHVKHKYRKLYAHEIKRVMKDTGKSAEELSKMYMIKPEVYINEDEYDKLILSMGGKDFTIKFDILSKEVKIGSISVTNVYVDTKKEVCKFMSTRPLESECIGDRICNKDFEVCRELDVILIEDININTEHSILDLEEVISMCETYIKTGICEIERVYIRALSINNTDNKEKDEKVLEALQRLGYVLVDENKSIMLKKLK